MRQIFSLFILFLFSCSACQLPSKIGEDGTASAVISGKEYSFQNGTLHAYSGIYTGMNLEFLNENDNVITSLNIKLPSFEVFKFYGSWTQDNKLQIHVSTPPVPFILTDEDYTGLTMEGPGLDPIKLSPDFNVEYLDNATGTISTVYFTNFEITFDKFEINGLHLAHLEGTLHATKDMESIDGSFSFDNVPVGIIDVDY